MNIIIVCVCTYVQEKFALPDPKVKEVEGASFAGFYYLGLKKASGEIIGYYYRIGAEQ